MKAITEVDLYMYTSNTTNLSLPAFSTLLDIIVIDSDVNSLNCKIVYECPSDHRYSTHMTLFEFKYLFSSDQIQDDFIFFKTIITGDFYENIQYIYYKKTPSLIELRDSKIDQISE